MPLVLRQEIGTGGKVEVSKVESYSRFSDLSKKRKIVFLIEFRLSLSGLVDGGLVSHRRNWSRGYSRIAARDRVKGKFAASPTPRHPFTCRPPRT